ncbi:MAG: ribonuclease E/G, partial [Bacteroidota bacterium]
MAKTKKEIVIHANKDEAHIAILEDGELAELHVENSENTRTIGDIQLAKVRNLMPSIQAAFVDIGMKQDAFLHFSDVSETLPQTLEMLGEKVKAADFAVTLR